ncbi:hypothetical protein [Nocardioides nanhaiensis]
MSDWADWAQNRRIREAEESIASLSASAARERQRLTAELQRQSGSLQQQIDSLREAFVAFVEYEDVRGELGQHADAAAVRRYAREVVAATIVGGRPFGVAEPADVPGYWLLPAARAVAAAGDPGQVQAVEEQLAEARRRDPRRTILLVTLVEAIRRQPVHSPALLEALLPRQSAVSRAERVIWVGVAEGRLGDQARARLLETLRARVEGLATEAVVAVLAGHTDERGDLLPTEVAARRLATLRRWVEGRTQPSRSPGAPRPGAASALGVDDLGPRDRQDAPTGAGATDVEEPEDPLADCLRQLVDEGAPLEADILTRMRRARDRMGGLTASTSDERRWDDPLGEAVDLLTEDLRGADVARHAVALQVLGPVLERTGRDLLAKAAAPPEREVALPVRGDRVLTVTPDGAQDSGWREETRDRAHASVSVASWWRPAAAAALGVGVVGLLLVAVAGAFALLGLVGLAAAVALGVQDHRQRGARDRHVTTSVGYVERQVEQTVRRLRDHRERSAAAHQDAVEHDTAVRSALSVAAQSAAAEPQSPVGPVVGSASRPSTT